jgi:hypothetical protein
MQLTLLSINSDHTQDLLFADLHGSVDGSPHGGCVLVDGHHAASSVVLEQGDVASILL